MERVIANPKPLRLALLLSGRGSNAEALAAALQREAAPKVEIALVVSNRREAAGLAWAQETGFASWLLDFKACETKTEAYKALLEQCQHHAIEGLVLAGFDRILPRSVVEAYPNRILNIHPSLLPKFGGKGMLGMAVHQAVLAAGETESGCTVHVVTTGVDEGPILAQATVPVLPEDTPETLSARVLAAEHATYSPAIIAYFSLVQSK
jgi:phosphoribosylglycinamide formyltransferase 1